MIQALLLDLDDTLLVNNIDRFLPAYLERLGAFLTDLVPAERFIPLLLQATRVMAENNDPERTLDRVFAASFYPSLGMTEESLRPRIEAFYESEFPRLRSLTRQIPEAQALVRQAARRGLGLAVAPRPLVALSPARLLGIPVYHAAAVPAEGFAGGSLGGVLAWVEEQIPASALPAARTPQALSATLRGDLAALITLASRLKAEDWGKPLP